MMFKILKVLNNNGILAIDMKTKKEWIFLGNGIGFGKKVNQNIEKIENAKAYSLVKKTSRGETSQILKGLDAVFIEIAGDILEEAKKAFGKVDNQILLPLADHIAFSIQRISQNMELNNPFHNEIKVLFEEEYQVALKGKEIIQNKTGHTISEDEVGYITLHIHTALTSEQISQAMNITMLIQEGLKTIEEKLDILIDKDSISYTRLINHMKFMIARVKTNEKLNLNMTEYVLENFLDSFQIAKEVCSSFEKVIQKEIPEIEVGYLALHIERVRSLE